MVSPYEKDSGEEERLLHSEIEEGVGSQASVGRPADYKSEPLTVDEVLHKIGFGRYQYGLCIALGWALSADAVEVYAVSFLLPFALCELQPTSLEKGFLTAVGFAGMLIGALLWGSLADVAGRRKVLLICQSMNALFSILSSLSQSFSFLIVMRLLSGIGVGGTMPVMLVYFVEFLPPDRRGRLMGLLVTFWMVGQFLIAGIAWGILPHEEWDFSTNGFRFNNWRIFLLVASFPCLTSALFFLVFPESPRFLVQKGKVDEAMKVFRRIFIFNRKAATASFPHFVIQRPETLLRPHGTRGILHFLKGVMARTSALVNNPKHRTAFFLTTAIYFCLGFSSYGLAMWFPELFKRMEHSNGTSVCSGEAAAQTDSDACSDAHDKDDNVFMDSFLQALATLPSNIVFMLVVDVIGRKVITGSSLLVSGLMIFFLWIVTSRIGSIALSMCFSAVNILSWNSMSLITSELFTTEVRSTAQGLQSAMVRLASVLANIAFGALIDAHCSVAILIMAAILVAGGCMAIFLPNTTKSELK